MYENIRKKSTFYENIFSLSPAYSLTIDFKSFEIKKYWKFDPEFKINMDYDEEYINEIS